MKNKEKYSLDKLIVSVTYEIVGIASIKIYHGIKRVYYKSYDVEEFALRWINDFIKWLEKDDEEEYIYGLTLMDTTLHCHTLKKAKCIKVWN
jgi:hypothetical protein